MSKNLIYYSVGGKSEYGDMIKLSISSIRKTNPIDQDILIITDRDFYLKYLYNIKDEHVYFHFIQNYETNDQIAFNRLKVFEYLDSKNFEIVLYLDTDILVNIDLADIFNSIEKNKLNVVTEKDDYRDHMMLHFSLDDYTEDDIEFFTKNEILPFNSGTLLFENTIFMKRHFSNVLNLINNHQGYYFTDQSFINSYFNKNVLTSSKCLNKFRNYLFMSNKTYDVSEYKNQIIHFFNDTFNGEVKIKKLKNVYDQIFGNFEFENRIDLIKNLNHFIVGKKGVEIGVLNGELSKNILENWDGILYMVDVWRKLGEEYNDISNMDEPLNEIKSTITNIKGLEDRGVMIRATSKIASEMFNDESLDFIYIDANHAYDFVKEDLNLWFPKLKKGGVFSGHDYLGFDWYSDPNFCPNKKDKYIYINTTGGGQVFLGVFGVNPAVDEFCNQYGYKVNKTKEWFGTWWFIK